MGMTQHGLGGHEAGGCGGGSGGGLTLTRDRDPDLQASAARSSPTLCMNDAGDSASRILTASPPEQVWTSSTTPTGRTRRRGGGSARLVAIRPASPAPRSARSRSTGDAEHVQGPVTPPAAAETPGYFIACSVGTGGYGVNCSPTADLGMGIGGTSASSPSFAGFVAHRPSARAPHTTCSLTRSPPRPASPFLNDITSGNNDIVCGQAGVPGGTESASTQGAGPTV